MTVLLPFLVNSALNFALGLLIALFLGPAAFGLYAIGAAIVVLVNTAMLDWLRMSAVRFYSPSTRASRPEIRATLDLLVAGISLGLAGLVIVSVVAGIDTRLPVTLLAAAVSAGIAAGLFDYHGAIARARFLDSVYARLILVKNAMALLLMVGGAWWTREPAMVLFGSTLSVAVALLSVRRALADAPLSFAAARADVAARFLRYGLPLVAGNAIYSLIPLLNRSLLVGSHGYEQAGYFSLASDIGLRLFGVAGSMMEIVLLREVLRIDEAQGREAALRRIAHNVAVVLTTTLPVAVGLWLVLPAFEALLVPPAFRGHVAVQLAILLPGFCALALFQAALYPVFLVGQRTGIATLAAMAGLAVNLLLWFVLSGRLGAQAVSVAQSGAFLAVLGITAVVALRALPVLPPWRDCALALGATAAMAMCLFPLRGRFAPALELPLMAVLGAALYAALVLAGNVAGSRDAVASLLGRGRMARDEER